MRSKKTTYYTFSAGKDVPSWMAEVRAKDSIGRFRNRGKKVVFGTSCVVIRFLGGYRFMPANNKYTESGALFISGVFNSNIDFKGGAFTAKSLATPYSLKLGDL